MRPPAGELFAHTGRVMAGEARDGVHAPVGRPGRLWMGGRKSDEEAAAAALRRNPGER